MPGQVSPVHIPIPPTAEEILKLHDRVKVREMVSAHRQFKTIDHAFLEVVVNDPNGVLLLDAAARLLDYSISHLDLVETALKAAVGSNMVSDVARVVLAEGIVHFFRENFRDAEARFKVARELADRAHEPDLQGISRYYLSRTTYGIGHFDDAAGICREAITMLPADSVAAALCEIVLAWVELNQGHEPSVKTLIDSAGAKLINHDHREQCNILALQSRLERQKGPAGYSDAEDYLRKAIVIYDKHHDTGRAACIRCMAHLALINILNGARLYEQKRTTATAAAWAGAEVDRCSKAADKLLKDARKLCGERPGQERLLDRLYYFRARWWLQLHDQAEKAIREAETAFTIAKSIDDSVIMGHSRITQSIAERGRNRIKCRQRAEEAFQISEECTDNRRLKLRSRVCLSMALLQDGIKEVKRAEDLWNEASVVSKK
jgi:tetratricopeptide (TPR) repeat protein